VDQLKGRSASPIEVGDEVCSFDHILLHKGFDVLCGDIRQEKVNFELVLLPKMSA
jgi:hypothetical protein